MNRIEDLFLSELQNRSQNGKMVYIDWNEHKVRSFNSDWAVVLIKFVWEFVSPNQYESKDFDTIIITDSSEIKLNK